MQVSFKWYTETPHTDNSATMADFLERIMELSWEVVYVDGSYAEVKDSQGNILDCHASGDGDFNHHIVRVESHRKTLSEVVSSPWITPESKLMCGILDPLKKKGIIHGGS